MPYRKHILAEGEYYHIFNRSIGRAPIFENKRDSNQFLRSLEFYLQVNIPIKYSLFKKREEREIKPPFLASVYVFVLMPNHFHLLVQQTYENGISIFLRRLTDSFSHYFNKKNQRSGPLFEGRFKSVHIETEAQLLHLSRYIHLNPTTSHLVEDPQDYYSSSYRDYVEKNRFNWLDTSVILNHFKTEGSYKKFVFDNIDYQRSLQKIKHQMLE